MYFYQNREQFCFLVNTEEFYQINVCKDFFGENAKICQVIPENASKPQGMEFTHKCRHFLQTCLAWFNINFSNSSKLVQIFHNKMN